MQDFRNLKVWREAHSLTLNVYRTTRSFPKEESYGLVSQIRRAVTSIPANIAEGCCRSSDAELKRFLFIAVGSTSELDYHLLLSRDLGLVDSDGYAILAAQVSVVKCMLIAFIKRLKAGRHQPIAYCK